MLIILSKDQRLNAWCGYPASHSDNWGRSVELGDGNIISATERLLHALSHVGSDEPLCLFAHGSDTAIGDPGRIWTVDDIAVILAMTLGQRAYTGPILIQACADSITNFSTHLALALSRQGVLNGVWIYGYNKPVPIVQVFPAPSQLDTNVELQPVQVT